MIKFSADGDSYEGEWKAGLKNGQGVHWSADGDVFDGDWKADMIWRGKVHHRFANGDVDSNSYHQNEIVGEGILALTRLSRVDCCCAKEKRKSRAHI